MSAPETVRVDPDHPDQPPQVVRAAAAGDGGWERFDADAGASAAIEAARAAGAAWNQPPAHPGGQAPPAYGPFQPAPGGGGGGGAGGGFGYDPNESKVFKAQTYGDLCSLAQEVFAPMGTPWAIRVERTAPTGNNFKGQLGVHAGMTDEAFMDRFGGHRYRLTLMSQVEGPGGDPYWRPTKWTVPDFAVPGAPKVEAIQGSEGGNNGSGPSGYPGQGGHGGQSYGGPGGHGGQSYPGFPGYNPRLEELKLQSELKEREMLLQRGLRGGDSSGGNPELIARMGDRAMSQQAEVAKTTIEGLQATIASLREELRDVRSAAASAESKARIEMRDVEERTDKKVREAKQEAEARATALLESKVREAEFKAGIERDNANRLVENARAAADQRIKDVELSREREIERRDNDHHRALEAERNEKLRSVESLKSSYDERIRSIEANHRVALDAAKEVNAMHSDQKDKLIVSLQARVEKLEDDNRKLLKEQNKPVLAQLSEAKALAQLTGMVDRSEIPDAPEAPAADGPKSIAENLSSALPAIASAVGPALAPLLARFAGMGAQPQPQQPPPQQQQPVYPRALPPPRPQVVGNVIGQPGPATQLPAVVPQAAPPAPDMRQPSGPGPAPAPHQPQPHQPQPLPTQAVGGWEGTMPAPSFEPLAGDPGAYAQPFASVAGADPADVSPPRPQRPKRPRPQPQAQPQPAGVTATALPAFAPYPAQPRFRALGPQPEPPEAVRATLTTVTEKAKLAVQMGVAPPVALQMVEQQGGAAALETLAAYARWVNVDNALVLLEDVDKPFWRDQVAREWLDGFWTLLTA